MAEEVTAPAGWWIRIMRVAIRAVGHAIYNPTSHNNTVTCTRKEGRRGSHTWAEQKGQVSYTQTQNMEKGWALRRSRKGRQLTPFLRCLPLNCGDGDLLKGQLITNLRILNGHPPFMKFSTLESLKVSKSKNTRNRNRLGMGLGKYRIPPLLPDFTRSPLAFPMMEDENRVRSRQTTKDLSTFHPSS